MPHCTDLPAYHGDQWVTVEIEVRGAERFIHRIDGEVVLGMPNPSWTPATGTR